MDLLEKWIWEKHRKHVKHRHLIDASQIGLVTSTELFIIDKRGDLLIPLRHNKNFWGQLVIEQGSDLNTTAISQIVDLADLYFKLKVSLWTDGTGTSLIKEQVSNSLIPVKKDPKIYFLKSFSPEKTNYIVSYLQEKLSIQGKLPWERGQNLNDPHLDSVILYIDNISNINHEDLLHMSSSERKPQIVIRSSGKLTDWPTWVELDSEIKSKLAIVDADLDNMPLTLSEAKDCIDLLWFAD